MNKKFTTQNQETDKPIKNVLGRKLFMVKVSNFLAVIFEDGVSLKEKAMFFFIWVSWCKKKNHHKYKHDVPLDRLSLLNSFLLKIIREFYARRESKISLQK